MADPGASPREVEKMRRDKATVLPTEAYLKGEKEKSKLMKQLERRKGEDSKKKTEEPKHKGGDDKKKKARRGARCVPP